MGTPGKDRTCNLSFRKAALYPVELRGRGVRSLSVDAAPLHRLGRRSCCGAAVHADLRRASSCTPSLEASECSGTRLPRSFKRRRSPSLRAMNHGDHHPHRDGSRLAHVRPSKRVVPAGVTNRTRTEDSMRAKLDLLWRQVREADLYGLSPSASSARQRVGYRLMSAVCVRKSRFVSAPTHPGSSRSWRTLAVNSTNAALAARALLVPNGCSPLSEAFDITNRALVEIEPGERRAAHASLTAHRPTGTGGQSWSADLEQCARTRPHSLQVRFLAGCVEASWPAHQQGNEHDPVRSWGHAANPSGFVEARSVQSRRRIARKRAE